jgi:hypothetical protein
MSATETDAPLDLVAVARDLDAKGQPRAEILATLIKLGASADEAWEILGQLGPSAQTARPDKTTDRAAAAALAEGVEVWRSSDGRVFATVEVDGHRENVPVRGRRFRAWLTLGF